MSPVPMESCAHSFKDSKECTKPIILYVSGGFCQIGIPLILLQFTKRIFRSQQKIIDQSHYFQLWVKLWNAAFATSFTMVSESITIFNGVTGQEGPLYLFWKQLHVKVIGLFTHHEKFEKQLHVHRIKKEITLHVKIPIIFTFHKHIYKLTFHVLNVFFSRLCE